MLVLGRSVGRGGGGGGKVKLQTTKNTAMGGRGWGKGAKLTCTFYFIYSSKNATIESLSNSLGIIVDTDCVNKNPINNTVLHSFTVV